MKSKVDRILATQYHVLKDWTVGRLTIKFEWRKSTSFMGRFGGGWQWALGFEAGPSSLNMNLLVCMLRFSIRPKATVGDLLQKNKTEV